MADDSVEETALPTSPYLMQPLRTLRQAQLESQSAQSRPDSNQIGSQESRAPSGGDFALSQEPSTVPKESADDAAPASAATVRVARV